MKVIPFKGQDFESLKRNYSSRNLFTDPIFKPDYDSLGFTANFKTSMKNAGVRWMRPQVMRITTSIIIIYFKDLLFKEINKNAKFVVEGFNRLDINQGGVGDCW